MNEPVQRSIADLLSDHSVMHAALRRAFEEAVRQHVQAGLPMAGWKDGKVVWEPADQVLARLLSEGSP
jgi:hypothetical protein